MAEVWITCPDCGEKVLSSRLTRSELVKAHGAVCPFRTDRTTAEPDPAENPGPLSGQPALA